MANQDSPHTKALANETKISKSLDNIHPDNRLAFMQKYLIANQPDASTAQTEPSSLDPRVDFLRNGTPIPMAPDANAGIPPELQLQDPNAIPKYLAKPPVDLDTQIAANITPTTPQSDKVDTSAFTNPNNEPDKDTNDLTDKNDSINFPSKPQDNTTAVTPASVNDANRATASTDTIPEADQGTETPDQSSGGLNAFQQAAKQARQDYGQAMQSDQDRLLMGGILKSSQMLGKAMGQTPGAADTSYADQILGQHNLSTNALKTAQDYQGEVANQAQEQAMRDPDSAPSKAAQDIYEKTTGHSGKGLPAIVIMKLLPEAAAAIYKQSQIVNMQEGLKVKQQNSDINQQKADTGDRRADTAQEKATVLAKTTGDKSVQAYAKDRDVMLAPRGSPLGMEVRKVTQATHSLDFLSNIKTPDDFDKATPLQKQELAYTFATLLSPTGTPDVHTVQHMNEQGVGDMLASSYQKLTGSTAPTNTAGLTKQLMQAVQKQQQVSMAFVNKHQDTVDNKYASQIQANPKAYQDIYDSTNIAPRSDSKYFKSQQPQSPTSQQIPTKGTFTQQTLQDYATKHNMNINAAKTYLTGQGYAIK